MISDIPIMIKVFSTELAGVEEDVLRTIDYYASRFQNHQITQYVWKENRALLQSELSCLKELEEDLATWPYPAGMTVEEALESAKQYLKNLAENRDYPGLVTHVLDRIGDKVSKYL